MPALKAIVVPDKSLDSSSTQQKNPKLLAWQAQSLHLTQEAFRYWFMSNSCESIIDGSLTMTCDSTTERYSFLIMARPPQFSNDESRKGKEFGTELTHRTVTRLQRLIGTQGIFVKYVHRV